MITFDQAVFRLSDKLQVTIPSLQLHPHDLIVLIGQNGSGKSVVARAVAGELPLISGSAPQHVHAEIVSF